jgi:hypothetical protein
MKPSSEGNDCRRYGHFRSGKKAAFPTTDCNYQAPSFHRYFGGPAETPSSSFLNISREYFRYEVRRNFVAEAAFFLAFAAILLLTFISGAIVIIHFLNLPQA